MEFDRVYVVMWEEYDGYQCTGGDLYMSLDPSKAAEFLHSHPNAENLDWNAETDMYIYRGKYAWEKMYIDIRMLEEEL